MAWFLQKEKISKIYWARILRWKWYPYIAKTNFHALQANEAVGLAIGIRPQGLCLARRARRARYATPQRNVFAGDIILPSGIPNIQNNPSSLKPFSHERRYRNNNIIIIIVIYIAHNNQKLVLYALYICTSNNHEISTCNNYNTSLNIKS